MLHNLKMNSTPKAPFRKKNRSIIFNSISHVYHMSNEESSFSAHVVPWVMPNESIPMRVSWPSSVKVQRVELSLSDGLSAEEFLNFEEVEYQGIRVIGKPKYPSLTDPNYVGLVAKYKAIPEALHISVDVKISIFSDEKLAWQSTITCNVFRPKVEVVKNTPDIILNDSKVGAKIPIYLRYTGFGEVKLSITSKIRGRIVSHSGSITYELLRRLKGSGMLEEEKDVNKQGDKESGSNQLQIDERFLTTISKELDSILAQGTVPLEELDKESLEKIERWYGRLNREGKPKEALFGTIQNLLLGVFLENFSKHPTRDVSLTNGETLVRTKIKMPLEKLLINIIYTDLANNTYGPVEITTNISDKREKNKELTIEVPISIEIVEDKSFQDVLRMNRGVQFVSAPVIDARRKTSYSVDFPLTGGLP